MRMQQVTHVDGVEERYVPGVGATPPSGLPRRLTPRWSLPPPGTPRIQEISNTDISLIRAGYKPDQVCMVR